MNLDLHDAALEPLDRSRRIEHAGSAKGWKILLLIPVLLGISFGIARSAEPQRLPPTPEQLISSRRELSSRRVMETGEFLPASLGGAGSTSLGPGFLFPTDAGSWMAQLSAELKFTTEDGASAVQIDLKPLVSPSDRTRQVTISSSIDVRQVILTGGRESVLVALDGGTDHSVTIQCDEINSPISLELGPDRRAFCALIYGIWITPEKG